MFVSFLLSFGFGCQHDEFLFQAMPFHAVPVHRFATPSLSFS